MPTQTSEDSPPAPVRVHHLTGLESRLARLVFWGLQPVLIAAILAAWLVDSDNPALLGLVFLVVHLLVGALEYRIPARPEWRHSMTEKAGVVLIVVFAFLIAGAAATAFYETYLTEPLETLRDSLNLDVWPHHWPLLAQVFLMFFASEFIWYWLHRAEHRWSVAWRLSGHGAHHAFKKLNAINAGANHPVEYLWLVLPSIFIELLFGVGAAASGAVLLTVAQTAIVHSNLRLNARVMGFLFTTNAWHIRHHSADREESNTNYGCAAIIWDRVFGTFCDGGVREAGIGSREPSTMEKFLMPVREPQGSVVAPMSNRV